MCDSKEMYEMLIQQHKTENQIIDDKIHFINQLVGHRNLKLEYHLIKPTKNIATEHLSGKNKTSASRDSRILFKSLINQIITFKRQALHAYFLSFIHPIKKNKIELNSKLPNDINALIEQLKLI